MKKLIIQNPTLETKKKLLETMELIRKGMPKSKIIRELAKKHDVEEERAYLWYHDAMMMIENANNVEDIDAETIKALQIERIEDILETTKDVKLRLKAIDMISKLYQLYVEKQEVKVSADTIKFSFDS